MANGKWDYVSGVVLFIINLLNYVDRYTVAGVLNEIQEYYKISDGMAGLIQTIFIVFFIIGSPICGYLGDRYNRKWITVVGVVIWLGAVVASTFAPQKDFWMFLLFRGVVGVGEASYSNVAPSMISDMFSGVARSRMYMLFYFAVPVGSGLGFVVGSNVSSALNQWQWGVRVTAFAGAVALILLIFFVFEPERGAADRVEGKEVEEVEKTDSSYLQDLLALVKIPTYVCCILAYTALIFVTGTLTWWEPSIIGHLEGWRADLNDTAELSHHDTDMTTIESILSSAGQSVVTTTEAILSSTVHSAADKKKKQIGLIFGAITTVAGLLGVALGTMIAGFMMRGTGPFRMIQTARAQPIVSGTGALIAAPILAIVFLFAHKSLILMWILLFLVITFLSLNWGLNVDMLMSVIIPSRRSTAFSYFMMISHTFGDASGPYLIGVISDALKKGRTAPKDQYWALVKASALTVGLLVLSGFFYYLTAYFLVRDQKRYKQEMGQDGEELPRPDSCSSVGDVKNNNGDCDNMSVVSEEESARF